MLEGKRLKISKAIKAKTCKLCPKSWEAGAKIYVLTTIIDDTWDLICADCGEALERPPTITLEKVYSLLLDLSEDIKTIKKYIDIS